jgi:hypothetical protein
MKWNLLKMGFLWIATSVSYYVIIYYLKYFEGDMFNNHYVSLSAEFFGVWSAVFLYKYLNMKGALIASYFICFLGALLITFLQEDHPELVPIFVLLSKFGISATFGLIYLANLIFPAKYGSQTMTFCNLCARVLTIASPVIVELPFPTPMVVLFILCGSAVFVTTRLVIKEQMN